MNNKIINETLVSIVIPAYNVENYIKSCLDSCINQNFEKYEIIVIDDGSTDSTSQVILDYKTQYPELIKSFRIENSGPGVARNYGVSKSSGEYIAFVDSDDIISKQFCFDMYNQAVENDADIVRCDFQRFFDDYDGNALESVEFQKYIDKYGSVPTELTAQLQLLIWHIPCTGIYRKQLIDDIGFEFPAGIIEDPVIKILFIEANKIVIYPMKMYHYRTRQMSITSKLTFEDRKVSLSRWKYILSYYESKDKLFDSGIIESFLYSSASYVTLINEIEENSIKDLRRNNNNGMYDEFIETYKKVDSDTSKIIRAKGFKKVLYRSAILNFYNEKYIKSKFLIILVSFLVKIKLLFNKGNVKKDKYYLESN